MSRYRKIVWNEGMLITPHHFQQWDNYHEDILNSRVSSLLAYEWGVLDLQLNRESIANGLIDVISCAAVMPDGLFVRIPQTDPAPEARPVAGHFDSSSGNVSVYLAVPAKRAGVANFQMNGGEAGYMTRYLQQAGTVIDETTGESEQQIAFARGNLRLLFTNEMRDGYSAIKIAELERTTTGHLALSEHYIPPALKITAAPWLANLLRQLIELLVTKSSILGEQRRQRGASLVDINTSEVALFLLLYAVNSAIPKLAHLFNTSLVHPERLYTEMAKLAGSLMTFVPDRHPKDIVTYNHEDLHYTFSRLMAEIRSLLETGIPTKCVQIPLEKLEETLYLGRVHDEKLLKEASFYLAVHAKVPESQLIDRVPLIIKIAARDEIDALVDFATPGVELRHASPPPASIPTRGGFHYFGLDRVSPYWENILGTKTISVYVPDEFKTKVTVEMFAIKP